MRNKILLFISSIILFLLCGCSDTDSMHREIVTNEESVREFLLIEGIAFDDVWIPEKSDLAGIDIALEEYLRNRVEVAEDDWRRTQYQGIKEEIGQYNKEYSGFSISEKKFIICNMHQNGGSVRDNEFTIILDGGCTVVRFIYDIENKKVISLECNGVA